jgi:hypothetical protein
MAEVSRLLERGEMQLAAARDRQESFQNQQ